ncbi:hypothetical protein HETIRDRAFT_101800 [Heterobasidion irregulare TC 32-1]|uniref:Uncharacterized protein n=1 Tax=Heterobasidion irregulare (strain TC 32-1) TaxID=747525 RepID=W4K4K1_HETIT|nr:uncharacterized protein HETIRDRAFT_101800 [Heterobasidion irregulare TC 32-1]ETW80679.1 hypothetical protein HETIRDRAFT_101800 [Heterobasidion irregulare TC 32-1]
MTPTLPVPISATARALCLPFFGINVTSANSDPRNGLACTQTSRPALGHPRSTAAHALGPSLLIARLRLPPGVRSQLISLRAQRHVPVVHAPPSLILSRLLVECILPLRQANLQRAVASRLKPFSTPPGCGDAGRGTCHRGSMHLGFRILPASGHLNSVTFCVSKLDGGGPQLPPARLPQTVQQVPNPSETFGLRVPHIRVHPSSHQLGPRLAPSSPALARRKTPVVWAPVDSLHNADICACRDVRSIGVFHPRVLSCGPGWDLRHFHSATGRFCDFRGVTRGSVGAGVAEVFDKLRSARPSILMEASTVAAFGARIACVTYPSVPFIFARAHQRTDQQTPYVVPRRPTSPHDMNHLDGRTPPSGRATMTRPHASHSFIHSRRSTFFPRQPRRREIAPFIRAVGWPVRERQRRLRTPNGRGGSEVRRRATGDAAVAPCVPAGRMAFSAPIPPLEDRA